MSTLGSLMVVLAVLAFGYFRHRDEAHRLLNIRRTGLGLMGVYGVLGSHFGAGEVITDPVAGRPQSPSVRVLRCLAFSWSFPGGGSNWGFRS
jgi:hypothetical protein